MKICTKCLKTKELNMFSTNKQGKGGLQPRCRECQKKYRREWYKANRELAKKINTAWSDKNPNHGKEWYKANKNKARNYQLKRDFGISIEEYGKMLELQGYRCKICLVDASKFNKVFAVDHSHKTGKIRGLLCGPCNSAIGLMKEKIEVFKSAISYLENQEIK